MNNSSETNKKSKKLISIITPFFNDEEVVEDFHDSLSEIINKLPDYAFEMICIDDGSSDQTLSELLKKAEKNEIYHLIELSRNFGKEAALTAGLDRSNGEAAIILDSDLQDPPELIFKLIEEWEKGADVVLPKRKVVNADRFFKRLTADIFYRFHNSISTTKIPRYVGDFRLMDKKVVEALKLLPENQRFMRGLFAWMGFKSVVIDYDRNYRQAGSTGFTRSKLWGLAIQGIVDFSVWPLKIWTYLGFFGSFVSIIFAFFVFYKTIVYGSEVPGYASLLIIIIFFGSVQLIGIGVLGEYLSKTYIESKRRPTYLIRKEYKSSDESV